MVVNLVYVPQMKEVAEFFRANNKHYQGEKIVSIEQYIAENNNGKAIILGRNGYHHHEDLDHITLIKNKRSLNDPEEISLILYDRHIDFLFQVKDMLTPHLDSFNPEELRKFEEYKITFESWAAFGLTPNDFPSGLEKNLYSHVMIIGCEPKEFTYNYEKISDYEIAPSLDIPHDNVTQLDRLHIYPTRVEAVEWTVNCPLDYNQGLRVLNNQSIKEYKFWPLGGGAIPKIGLTKIYFKSVDSIDYSPLKNKVITSTDVDVINTDDMTVDFPNAGGLTIDKYIELIKELDGKEVEASIISGFTEDSMKRNEKHMDNLSRIISAHCSLLNK